MTWWVVLDDRVGRSGLQDGTFGMTWSIVKDDVEHSETQGFGLGPKFPLSQSLHANHSGGEMPLGRMDWSRTDFWLAVGTGKNRSSTTTSPCTPYPLPSELQGDKVGKDYLLQNLHLDMRSGISNGQPHSTLEKARFLAEKIQKIDYVNPRPNRPFFMRKRSQK